MQALLDLSLREKGILAFAFLAILGLSFHALLWEPLINKSIELQEQVDIEQENLVWIKQNIKRLQTNKQATKNISGSLASWLDLQLKQNNLKDALQRIKPKGDVQVKIWLENANVTQLMTFLSGITQYKIKIDTIKMSALDVPGFVDVSIVIESQQ